MTEPTVALSIMQPWAWLIVNGFKDIENRDWRTHRRGRVFVHAGKKIDSAASHALLNGRHPATGGDIDPDVVHSYIVAAKAGKIDVGGIVGEVEITGCFDRHESPWFVGDYGFTLANPRPLPFRPYKGALSFFRVDS